jgi:hypothetical protein
LSGTLHPSRCRRLCREQIRPDRLTQTLAAEFGPQNIRVNAILPGAVDTDMYREMNNTPTRRPSSPIFMH